jgi:hypothetical protein
MNGRVVDLNFDVGVILSACYRYAGLPDVTNGYLRPFACVWNRELVWRKQRSGVRIYNPNILYKVTN